MHTECVSSVESIKLKLGVSANENNNNKHIKTIYDMICELILCDRNENV